MPLFSSGVDGGLESVKLFSRAINLVVSRNDGPITTASYNNDNLDGLDLTGLDIEFNVEKTLKQEPNTCEVLVYNLSETSRKAVSGGQPLVLKLEAGYQGGTSLLYLGEVRSAWTVREGPDFVTHFESGDGEKEMRKNRLNVSYGSKVPVSVALSAITDALKLGQGNVATVAATLATKGIATINGGALTGSAAQRMTDFCRSAGLEWSIQNGAIQILDIGKVISGQALEISAKTGMIESPTVDNDGILSFTTLMIPGLQPGVLVTMDSLFVQGGYRVERCKYHGQINGNDWQIDCEAKVY